MDPNALKSELRRRSTSAKTEVVTTAEDVKAKKLKRKKAYGEKSYWDFRYDGEDVSEDYDWLCDWPALRPCWEREVGSCGRGRVLHTGCGNSALGARLVEEGYAKSCVNVDYSPAVIERMARAYPRVEWARADCTDMVGQRSGSFDVVLDKGTLDAMACHDDAARALKQGRMYVSECFRTLKPGGVCLIASFGQPETRRKFFQGHDTAEEWGAVEHATLKARARKNDTVHVCVLRKAKRRYPRVPWRPLAAVAAFVAAAVAGLWLARRDALAAAVARKTSPEPTASAAQCNYEMLMSFAGFAGSHRWTLGAGTLLGAMRTEPPGLLQWEHDVDIYMPARDAEKLIVELDRHCTVGRRSPTCGAIEFWGFVDDQFAPCCGFGFKLYHATRDPACELDVLVLGLATYAPWTHAAHAGPGLGEKKNTWPPKPLEIARLKDRIVATDTRVYPPSFFVIPEDIAFGTIMGDPGRWDRRGGGSDDWAWNESSVSFFQDEWFAVEEFEPFKTLRLYDDFDANIPNDAWASLKRTYGNDADRVARLDEHGGVRLDLRLPENAHLKAPAPIALVDVATIRNIRDEDGAY